MTTPTFTMPMDTPVGQLVLESDGDVLIGIWLPSQATTTRGTGTTHRRYSRTPPPSSRSTSPASAPSSTVPMELDGTPFQKDVWTELTRIPYGETISYGELARRVGRPKGPRAVGQANGKNPIPIIVPCHRVLASTGIGGYGGGLPMKRTLLAVEGVTA